MFVPTMGDGHANVCSLFALAGCATVRGVPPTADTAWSGPLLPPVENIIVSSSVHVPVAVRLPLLADTTNGQIISGTPPATGTFLIAPSAKKPIQRLSGEKNGLRASAVPGKTVAAS